MERIRRDGKMRQGSKVGNVTVTYGQGEVFTERMSFETVIGQDPSPIEQNMQVSTLRSLLTVDENHPRLTNPGVH
jgi:hypothetical protein